MKLPDDTRRVRVRKIGFLDWECDLEVGYRTYRGLGLTKKNSIRDALRQHYRVTKPWVKIS